MSSPKNKKPVKFFTGFSLRGKDDITALSLFAAVRIYIIAHRARIVKGCIIGDIKIHLCLVYLVIPNKRIPPKGKIHHKIIYKIIAFILCKYTNFKNFPQSA